MMYMLNGVKTYATVSSTYQQGVQYSGDQLGPLTEMKSPTGKPLFVPAVEVEQVVQAEVGLIEEAETVEEGFTLVQDGSDLEAVEAVEEFVEPAVEPVPASKKVVFGRKSKADDSVVVV